MVTNLSSFKPKLLTVAISSVILTACGGGGGSSSGSSGSNTVASTYALPEQLEIVSTEDDSGDSSAQLARSMNSTARSMTISRAFNDAGTDYENAEQRTHTWMEALEPVELVNTILCFTGQMNADDMVGEGAYTALIDMDECESGNADNSTQSSGQSSAGGNTTNYVEAYIVSTRDSSTGNVIVHAWVPEMDVGEGEPTLLKMRGVIESGATDEDPFGSFVLNWEMKDPANPDGEAFGWGELATVETLDGYIGFTLYDYGEYEEDAFSGSYLARASVVMRDDRSDGVALTALEDSSGWGDRNMAFAVSFNSNNVLLQEGGSLSELPFRNGGSNSDGMCLAKDDFKEAVWRYGMFDKDTGEEVRLNGGFPIRYDSDNDGNVDSFGYASYWGIWTDDEGALDTGDTVVRESNGQGGSAENYTVVKTEGRLIKKEIESLPLSDAAGIDFYYWDDALFESQYDQWVVRYVDGQFKKVAGLNWGEQGPQRTTLDTPIAITLEAGHPLFMHSDQLGGGVQYKQGATALSFYKETIMNGSEAEFSGGALDLVCVDRCIKTGLTASDLSTFDGGYLDTAATMGDAYDYSISNSGINTMSLTSGGNVVGFPDNVPESSPNAWGVQSGPMVTAAVAGTLSDPYEVYDAEQVSTFYVWETGPNDWNKTTMLLDSLNEVVTFDKPIEFSYTHSEANHRDGSANSYAEVGAQTFMLHYSGPGDLHGIPHVQIGGEESDRWYPLFNLNDGAIIGPAGEYVVKALDIERKMNEDEAGCGALVVNEPAAPVPSEVSVNLDELGDVPEVDGSPSFVGGEAADS
ncbi:hypothetical protein [Hahella ganghwensis]|uniref:hypothetical protein n=1 Tax=Hahella ganghwensis TaxID=286420 RepID=UPI0003641901|nr:hypothetical protein [Hahella ganghwensis]